METIITILALISGIAWTIVYIDSIYIGRKQKTYAIPLWALALNIGWEAIYSVTGLANPTVQTLINFVWCIFDLLIIVTYFQNGQKDLPARAQKYFVPYSILVFVSAFALQLMFYEYFDTRMEAAQYSAFLQNVLMSVLFLGMLFRRDSTRGQSVTIAIAKWIGTLAPAIQQGLIMDVNLYIIVCGVLCSVFDLTYLYFLLLFKKSESNAEKAVRVKSSKSE